MASPTLPVRRKVCYAVSVCEIVCGCLMFVFAIVLQSMASRGVRGQLSCGDYVGSAFTHGACFLLVGAFGVMSSRPASRLSASIGVKTVCALHVVLCLLVALPVAQNSHDTLCMKNIKWSGYERAETIVLHITVILKFIVTFAGQILAAIGAGFSLPELCFLPSNSYSSSSPNEKRSHSENKGTLSKPALHLPEARTHVQEVPETGEKVTVVSLPHAEGVVYAVPEDQYVVKRGECTYAAPSGNPRLTAFFPTYTKVQTD